MKLLDIVFHNFWPKIISLVLAVATWFYVFDLISNESYHQKKETAEDILARSRLTVKEVPVKPVFTGKTPEGYKVDYGGIVIDPGTISILGPATFVEKVDEIRTDRINLDEYTRSVTLRLGIHSDVRAIRFENKFVELYLPVEKNKDDLEPGHEKTE